MTISELYCSSHETRVFCYHIYMTAVIDGLNNNADAIQGEIICLQKVLWIKYSQH